MANGPAVDDWEFTCQSDTCEAAARGTWSIYAVENIEQIFPNASEIPGYPPADADVTHICYSCGMWYYGVAEELRRRLDASARQDAARAKARASVKHDEYGWVEPLFEQTKTVCERAEKTTPYDYYRVLMNHVYGERGSLTPETHRGVVEHWVPWVGADRAERMYDAAVDAADVPADLIERSAAEYM